MSTSNTSTDSNQQTLANSGANERIPMLEKGNYIPWESRFRRFLDNKLEDGERMWNSIQNGPYQRPMGVDPTNPTVPILEPLSEMTEGNKKQYIADNDKEMWERIKRLMHGSEITTHVRHSRLMDEFDKFAAKEEESLDSVHERLTTLVNIMDCNNVCPIPVAINTKFLNCLQPKLSKYVTMVRHNQTGPAVDVLYDQLVQFKPHVLASRAKKGELQGDSQKDKLTTAMMLLAQAISQKFSTPTNNRLRVSSNTRNQAVVQDGRVDIQTKNAGYGGNANKNAGRNRTQGFNAGNAGHYACECQKPKVRDAKYFREQMLLAMKDEVGSNLSNEENDFMLDTSYGQDLEDLTVAVMLMARLQPADDNAEIIPSYDAKAVSQVHASSKIHEQVSHGKCQTIIQTTDDDQIDSNIIFDDPLVENNGGTSKHDSTAHDEYHLLQQELETFKDQVKTFESTTIQYSTYKETCDELERELRNDKDTIDRLVKEKEQIQNDFLKVENEKIIIQHETKLEKKAFKERENRYLDDILDLEEKLSSHDRIVYKMGQSIQTIHMLGKKPNKVYDPFLKAGLGYTNPERLKKAIAAQPKMYDGDLIHSNKLVIHSTDSEETLEDAEESRNKMRHKMVQIDYEKLNALYDTFVPQQEPSAEQTYFSIPSTSDNGSTSKDVPSESPGPKMPNESRLLKMIDTLGDTIVGFQTRINKTFLQDTERRWMSDSQNELREFYKTDVIPMSRSLYKTLSEIKEELIEEVHEMLNIFESMEQKVNGKSPTEIPLKNEIDRLLEVSLTSEIRDCVLLSVEQ
ncbi:hypothetical protein Tco_1028608 [Tanacetum coccineum]|uniref:Uncharacterized protein n=1 Tax=Tanacetum coccineum TaxID=301880 RepID=A0ABQ5G390_9ASTR